MPDQGRKQANETKRSYQAGRRTQTTTRVLTPRRRKYHQDARHLTSVELFAGAGGLGMGVGRAGFESKLVIDWDGHACATIRTNQALNHPAVSSWPLRECDVRDVDFRMIGTVDLVSGGPPCQPFSLGGKHHGPLDDRDMFPQAIRAVRELMPRAFVFENVPGLKRPAFSHYLGYIRDQLAFPEVTIRPQETWMDHARRLRRESDTANTYRGLAYRVQIETANAADFGVPQKRERMFMVGLRSDLEVDWTFPRATHSQDALLWQQWITGEYWDRHRIATSDRPSIPSRLRRRLEPFQGFDIPPPSKPWRTVRDALNGLSDPEFDPTSCRRIPNHQFNPGARVYAGHTGSRLDEPAKVLKAGDHGVPGGENMLARDDGTCRYFSVREAARLQTFPDSYVFPGSWTETMRQIGNAVPVKLAHVFAIRLKDCLTDSESTLDIAV